LIHFYKRLIIIIIMYSVAVTRNMLRLPSSSLLSCQTMATMKPIAASEALQGQEFWSKNKRLARPMSPHLTIYKPQLTSMMSITHRITGCVQSGILSGAALGVLVMPVNFPILLNEIQQLQLGGLTIFSLKFLLSVPVTYHFWNGFRHLAWDLGHGFKINELYKSGWFVCGLTVVSAIALAML